jgi:thiamine-phosphate pyrophosphorylase
MQLLPSLTVFDYAFFGPVFDSLSKPGHQSCVGADFRLNKQSAQPKVIALGGVEAQYLQQVKTMGFDGAAVLGTIWNQPQKALPTFEQLQSSITAL